VTRRRDRLELHHSILRRVKQTSPTLTWSTKGSTMRIRHNSCAGHLTSVQSRCVFTGYKKCGLWRIWGAADEGQER